MEFEFRVLILILIGTSQQHSRALFFTQELRIPDEGSHARLPVPEFLHVHVYAYAYVLCLCLCFQLVLISFALVELSKHDYLFVDMNYSYDFKSLPYLLNIGID